MSASNGLVTRRRLHAVPRTLTFEIEVERNGAPETIDVTGHIKGSHPVWVELEVDAAWDAWREASYVDVETTDSETGEATTRREHQESPRAEALLRRDMLLAVTRGLEEQDADILAAEGGGWLDVLRDLGWWRKAAEDEAVPDPEATAPAETAPTGAPSSSASAPSTAPTTG